MDTKKKIFFMSALALLACSCQEDKITDPTGTAAPGVEVNFGGMLGDGETRTIYGPMAEDGSYFPIYWVNGDQVLIASPECANNGVPTATYAVSVDANNQSYATSMDKTGEIGVRWGDNPTGTFNSIYPVVANSDNTIQNSFNSGYTSARVTVTTQQNNVWNMADNTVAPDMHACIMYAQTTGVNAGEDVNLAYKPLSTAVRFTVSGPKEGDGEVTIQYIRLYAPKSTILSGQFDVDFSDMSSGMPKVTAVDGNNNNYASMNATGSTGAFLTLGVGERAEVQLFFLLENEVTMNDQWYIDVALDDGRLFRKYITANAGGKMTLKPGQIHKLPDLPNLSESAAWDPSNWMTNIQRNVYLSEISIPGSWNSLNRNFQGANPSLTAQYNAGVRAFHLDTRWIATGNLITLQYDEVVDLGIANGGEVYYESWNPLNRGGRFMRDGECLTFTEALSEITSRVQPDEYLLVYCTFAQGSATPSGYDWRATIAEACKNNDAVIDARTLDENTVVGDVLGHVIVVVSTMYHDTQVSSKAFYADLRNEIDHTEFDEEPYFTRPLFFNNDQNNLSGIQLYATYAQITRAQDSVWDDGDGSRGYEPTLDERQVKCGNLLDWSRKNYNDGISTGKFGHNSWIFMGLGGYTEDNEDGYAAVSNRLVSWLDGRLAAMETAEAFYPVGIVFMNRVLNSTHPSSMTVDTEQTMKDIMLLNGRYRKAYDPNRSPATGDLIVSGSTTVKSAAPGYSSGMVDNRQNAIVWE